MSSQQFRFILRMILLPIIAIPVIILGWLLLTIAGLSIIWGLLCILSYPLLWLIEQETGMQWCCKGIEFAKFGIACPFFVLYYFVFDVDKLKGIM